MNPAEAALKGIFCEALNHTAGPERSAFLDRACGENATLRLKVESLLMAHDEAGGFLGSSVKDPAIALAYVKDAATSDYSDEPKLGPNGHGNQRTVTEGPGTIIGPYKLLQQIGEGGFGVVYMAEQERPVRRIIALKIIKPGMDTAQVIARFESERQALALMDHPNIAKVLDAGATNSGRPYFVMELVKGIPITEFCDKNHLPPEGRLKLFVDVCHAIQHAHHKGVIHRDIKPSNVMVTLHDGVPVVKVIDFGVAKATVQKLTERTLFTAYGQMIGTPAYMSPEQAEMSGLDIDTRSDVYALGVLLYELLTGTTPLESKRLREAGYAEMQRLIREEEAPRPSTRLSSMGDSATVLAGNRGLDVKKLVQLLAGDLDWLVMKAMEKDRNRRYVTPGNFAEDIERYLRSEAILARPPSTVYKIRKFAHRNRAAVLTTAAVALALLVGTAVAIRQAVRATAAESVAIKDRDRARAADDEARAERNRAIVEKNRADKNFALARKAVEDYLTRVTDDADLKDRTDFTSLRKRLLESAIPFYQQFAPQLGVDPTTRAESGRTFMKLASVQFESGNLGETVKSLRQAKDIYTQLATESPKIFGFRSALVNSTSRLAYFEWRVHDTATATRDYHEAERLAEQLVSDFPKEPEARSLRADVLLYGEDFGEDHFDEAIRELRDLVREHPKVVDYQTSLSMALGNSAIRLDRARRSKEAEAAHRESVAIDRQLFDAEPKDPSRRHQLANGLFNYGGFLHRRNRPSEGLPLREEASRLLRQLMQDFPSNVRFRHMLARNQKAVGLLLADLKRPDDAILALREAVLLMDQLPTDYPHPGVRRWRLADFTKSLATALESRDRWDEASGHLDKAVRLLTEPPSLFQDQVVKGLAAQSLAEMIILRLQHFAKARNAAGCRQAAELWEELTGTDSVSLYNAACFRAITAAVIKQDPKIPAADAARLAEEEADRAMSRLTKAVAAGYKDAAHMKEDKDLDVLRTREDFKKLLLELGAKP